MEHPNQWVREGWWAMSTMQQAFQEVGYKPSGVRLRTLRKLAAKQQTFERVIDEVFAPITRNRKVVITKAGGFVRARYEGRRTYVFGSDVRHATSRLKTWDLQAA
jgi:hypothetical protein